ncbi:MAG: cytochrome c biogenesis protein CcsA [Armatimonadetes bacterium]|nr:cytochrome c biogenesis protein CcsA [Armatimonadota bacterium]
MNWKTPLFVLGCIGAVVYALTAPPAKSFPNPELARILFFHLPCAFVATGLIIHSAWLGMRFLQTREHGFDARNAAATELALLFAALTMASGIVFSRVQWGAWWQNDPRQTSFLMVLMLCGAGVAIRGGLVDEVKTAKAASAYSVATVLPMLFLIFVLPRILVSFHPSDTLIGGQLDGAYWFGILCVFALMVWATRYMYVKRYGKRLAVSGETSDGRVVRPVPVSLTDDE